VVFISAAATRYRLPLEPAIVVLACATGVWLLDRRRESAPETASPRGAGAG
jgi:hypothetical protein